MRPRIEAPDEEETTAPPATWPADAVLIYLRNEAERQRNRAASMAASSGRSLALKHAELVGRLANELEREEHLTMRDRRPRVRVVWIPCCFGVPYVVEHRGAWGSGPSFPATDAAIRYLEKRMRERGGAKMPSEIDIHRLDGSIDRLPFGEPR